MSTVWPLCFRYTSPIIGRRFVSHIDICGRLIAAPELDGTWLYGVNPGALAASGKTLADAYSEMRDTLTTTFVTFAQEASSFEDFKASVETYFNATDDDLADWEAAVEQIRSGHAPVPQGLRRCPDPEVSVKVTLRAYEQLTPADNPVNQPESLTSAA
jgi:hypothetical protein